MNSTYESSLKMRLIAIIGLLGIVAIIFYQAQNSGQLTGGEIALPKLLWLGYAILFWIFLPLLISTDKRVAQTWRLVYSVHLINMLMRASVELIMMYVTNSWSPYYGIAHDVFSILLLASLLFVYRADIQRDIFMGYALLLQLTLVVEIAFVAYMLNNVVSGSGTVFFVPTGIEHGPVHMATWVIVCILSIYLYGFIRRWVHGEFIRKSC